MREIKFRAWDKEKKEWICEGFNILGECMMFGILFDRPIEKLNDIEIEQFTGLHDSDGKEIYEGDRVEDEFGEQRVIKWFDDLGYDGNGAVYSGFYYDIMYKGHGELEYHNSLTKCKVIGNIHDK